jgi:hypothetical protein
MKSCDVDAIFVTRHRSVLMTEGRLKLALSSGLSVAEWTFDDFSQTALICYYSIEPELVMALLRVHGVPWSSELCNNAAEYNKLKLLKWLHASSCPWDAVMVVHQASACGSAAMLEWLLTVTAPWSSDMKTNMFQEAGCNNNLSVTQWLRSEGVNWPPSFSVVKYENKRSNICWSVSSVQWALARGAGWLQWNCADYAADKYEEPQVEQQATQLLEWAHANGCPCTCGHVQQQQQ